jgi:hypothetical protein
MSTTARGSMAAAQVWACLGAVTPRCPGVRPAASIATPNGHSRSHTDGSATAATSLSLACATSGRGVASLGAAPFHATGQSRRRDGGRRLTAPSVCEWRGQRVLCSARRRGAHDRVGDEPPVRRAFPVAGCTARANRPKLLSCLGKPRNLTSTRQALLRAALLVRSSTRASAPGLGASRLGEFGYLTSFGALRRYDSRPRFPKELKELTRLPIHPVKEG